MRKLAQRIERLLRNDFLLPEEALTDEGQKSFEDRQLVLTKVQELVKQGYDYPVARQMATQDWITNFLNDNCMKF